MVRRKKSKAQLSTQSSTSAMTSPAESEAGTPPALDVETDEPELEQTPPPPPPPPASDDPASLDSAPSTEPTLEDPIVVEDELPTITAQAVQEAEADKEEELNGGDKEEEEETASPVEEDVAPTSVAPSVPTTDSLVDAFSEPEQPPQDDGLFSSSAADPVSPPLPEKDVEVMEEVHQESNPIPVDKDEAPAAQSQENQDEDDASTVTIARTEVPTLPADVEQIDLAPPQESLEEVSLTPAGTTDTPPVPPAAAMEVGESSNVPPTSTTPIVADASTSSPIPPVESAAPTPPPHDDAPSGTATPASSVSSSQAPSMSRSTTTASLSNGTAAPVPLNSTTAGRRSSIASTGTISAPGSNSLVSGVLVVSALESIANSKEAKKSKPLKDAVDHALELLKSPVPSSSNSGPNSGTVDPHVIFAPLRLACETKSIPLMITALDCIGKLVSYDFFIDSQPPRVVPDATDDDGASEAPLAEGERPPLADLVTSTVCDCFSPSPASTSSSSSQNAAATTQHDTLLLRLLSSLLSLILSQTLSVHQSSLLKAVRTVYNVFLMGSPGTVQTVAQATLGQIVGGVFGRISLGEAGVVAAHQAAEKAANHGGSSTVGLSGSSSKADLKTEATGGGIQEEGQTETGEAEGSGDVERTPTLGPSVVVSEAAAEEGSEVAAAPLAGGANGVSSAMPPSSISLGGSTEDVTLESIENRRSFDGVRENGPQQFISTNDLHIKDAFLVFRALCKLSMKPLGADSERDLKSHAMRSKLLSLHLVWSILNNHIALFVDPNVVIHSSTSRERTPFIQAVKQYLCLALSRNAVSPVIQVFELSCEIFWRVLSGMRTKLKKEIEVLLTEIFLPILEMRNSTVRQKSILLAVFGRLAQDPQALVDIYLNYDCDRELDNIYERLLNIVSKLGTTHFPSTNEKQGASTASAAAASPFPTPGQSLSEDAKFSELAPGASLESHLKRQSLETLVAVLKSLVSWAGKGSAIPPPTAALVTSESSSSIRNSEETARTSETDLNASLSMSSSRGPGSGAVTPDVPTDDPSRFENAKQRKTTLLEGIKKFNFKPKRGIDFLIETGFIRSREPKDVARFLLNADGLDKAQIGEYLGEGEAGNVATMHAFVDYMSFTDTAFVDALRMFLQSFRLPGEAQKIDRYMLKFAERYTAGNPGVFANADTAYILAFSVILLNTDAHNPQVKKPMSKVEFVKNNRGIDDGKDLEEALLSSIYDEINANEIRMKDEVEAAGPQTSTTGLASAIATVGRDLQREAYVWQSEGMVNKTEALFRTLVRGQRRGASGRPTGEDFYSASHFEHVKPMFEVAWMPILAGVSAPLQTTDEIELIQLSLEGFKQAIKIVCLFDMELERNAFVTTLAKFTFLNNFGEMKPKNVEAIKALLDIAMVDGNYLKGSWREVLTCVSQLERFQLIAQGIDSQAVPELGRRSTGSAKDRRSTLSTRMRNSRPTDEVANETRSRHITITADMIFSSTPQLSAVAINDFVQALSDVSWEEIQASGLAEQPRVFCLQKLVEISYYNMNRIRLEWSSIWTILGEHFNQVTCHTNAKVSFLALDSLRQLAMRFLEKEELANFKFQKDFLKPFEFAMIHNNNPDARDMVLQCLHQMIQARVQNLRSGWRTMFGVFSAAAKVLNERIAVQAFELVQSVNKEHFGRIVAFGSFADLTVCITDFCKISKYQRASLQAIEMLRQLIPMMLNCPECPLSPSFDAEKAEPVANDDPHLRFWFPVLFGFYDVIMNGEDLEVRKRALDYLFETLKQYGHTFPPEFWDTVCKEVLFPIFAVLRSRSDVSRFSTHEDMSVWLSTTMIQALRNLVDLFSFYFDVLARMLDRLLDLLCECICQENDTLARIGTSCLQQLLESNVEKLSPDRWERIVSTFVQLFKTTTAYQLFDENLLITPPEGAQSPDAGPAPGGFIAPTPLSPAPPQNGHAADEQEEPRTGYPDRRRIFRQIIVKCVLQLLLIETTHELLQNEKVYTTIPPAELLRLMAALDESYRFARKFNADKDLRMALWKVGFMRDLPNLLRQESTSAATLVNVLLRMYANTAAGHAQTRADVVAVFAPLGMDVLANYVSLNPETQTRNIAAWTPVCVEILQGFCSFEDEVFKDQLPRLYPLATNTLAREMDPAIREGVRALLIKVGTSVLGIGRGPPGQE